MLDQVTKAYSISNDLANRGHNCWLHTVSLHLKNLGYNPDLITPNPEELQTRLQDQHLQQSVNVIKLNAHHGPTRIGENKLLSFNEGELHKSGKISHHNSKSSHKTCIALTKFPISNHQLAIE